MQIETRYARNGDVTIAWTEVGEGPIDMLFVLGGISHVEHLWDEPGLARYLERLAGFARVICMDRRGVGLSDPVSGPMTMEDECADVVAVLDAAGSERAVLYGLHLGRPALHPLRRAAPRARARARALRRAGARRIADDGLRHEVDAEERRGEIEASLAGWGGGRQHRRLRALTRRRRTPAGLVREAHAALVEPRRDARALAQHRATTTRAATSATLRVPTLILHRGGDRAVDVRHSRYIAERIPGARYVELDGIDNLPSVGDTEALVAEIEEFLTGQAHDARSSARC